MKDDKKEDKELMREILHVDFEKEALRIFNEVFALISLITFLVFTYIIIVKVKMPDIFTGINGVIVILTITICVLGYIHGYTLIKGLIRRIIAFALENKKKDYLKTIFVSIITHDFKNFLGAMQLNLQNVTDGYLGPVSDRQMRLFKDSRDSIEKMERMTNDLLELSRFETGAIQLKKTPIVFDELVVSVLQKMEEPLRAKKIEVKTAMAKGLSLYADSARIEQAVKNILLNAVSHTENGKSILVDVKRSGDRLTAAICNEGEGVSGEEVRYLFEGFRKRPDSYFEIKEHGLGLAISKGIIKLHGGDIWTENIADFGSKIIFTLPLKDRNT